MAVSECTHAGIPLFEVLGIGSSLRYVPYSYQSDKFTGNVSIESAFTPASELSNLCQVSSHISKTIHTSHQLRGQSANIPQQSNTISPMISQATESPFSPGNSSCLDYLAVSKERINAVSWNRRLSERLERVIAVYVSVGRKKKKKRMKSEIIISTASKLMTVLHVTTYTI
ncbi:hypothetical protein PUN28_003103 [Cardiocondyla obscurior]|uniref:Uncharacterized protein n=1 Tax=Cardiocondyla obscurior TaxID=286306 RepID=A0AAW2GMB4_9HYME